MIVDFNRFTGPQYIRAEVEIDILKLVADLRDRTEDVVLELLGPPVKHLSTRREWRWGNKGSLKVNILGSRRGRFHDFEDKRDGDLLELIRWQERVPFLQACDKATDILRKPRGTYHTTAGADERARRDDLRALLDANTWFAGGKPINGTIAETYLLQARCLRALPPCADDDFRFHPACPFGSGIAPCLLAQFRDIWTGERRGILRIALTPDGSDRVGKRSRGPTSGAAIMLWPRGTSKALAIVEGLETGISLFSRVRCNGTLPVWALGGAGAIADFPTLPGVDTLVIGVDHDVPKQPGELGAGQRASAACRTRWLAEGRRVLRLMPAAPGADFNDLEQP
ncbi:MAG: toprim domain-containing protein [Xanthobacteraceae bacterium]